MPKRILAIDDSDDVLYILGFALEQAGFAFHGAHNGQEMRAALAHELPDLVVLDLMLPDVNGYQVIEELHQNAQTRAIPVIVVTAKAEAMYERMSADLGVTCHMIKPFHPDSLVAQAQAILQAPSCP